MKPFDEQRAALDAAATAVHWTAKIWSRVSPEVSARLRRIADRLAARSVALRTREDADARHDEDPLDPDSPPS